MILPSFAGPVSVYKSETSLDVGQQHLHTTNMQFQMQQVHQFPAAVPIPFENQSLSRSYEENSVLY